MMLAAKYKTREGAEKRCASENALAPGEYKRGETARLYRFTVIEDPYYKGTSRVQRSVQD
jgi:hypothetical protein